MSDKIKYDIELKSNAAKLLADIKEIQKHLNEVEGKDHKIDFSLNEKKLQSLVSDLDKALDGIGKNAGSFRQLENLSNQLKSAVSDVNELSKAFRKADDFGAKNLLSSIQNISSSLSDLNSRINSTVQNAATASAKLFDNSPKENKTAVLSKNTEKSAGNAGAEKSANALISVVKSWNSDLGGAMDTAKNLTTFYNNAAGDFSSLSKSITEIIGSAPALAAALSLKNVGRLKLY